MSSRVSLFWNQVGIKTIDRDSKEIQKKQYDVINLLNTKAAII